MKPRNPIARVVRTIRPQRIPDKRRLLHDEYIDEDDIEIDDVEEEDPCCHQSR